MIVVDLWILYMLDVGEWRKTLMFGSVLGNLSILENMGLKKKLQVGCWLLAVGWHGRAQQAAKARRVRQAH